MRTAKNAVWLTACRLSGDVLNLVLFVLISRQFGPAGIGVYSYGFAVATFVFTIGCLGIEEYGIRSYSRMDSARQPVFLGELLGTQAVMVALACVGLAIYLLITAPDLQKLWVVLELTCYQITAAAALSLFIPEMSYERMQYPALAELASRVVAFSSAGLAIYVFHASLAVALAGFPLAALVWTVIAVRSARGRGPLHVTFNRSAMSQIGRIIWSFALIEIFGQLFAKAGVIVLSLAVSDAAAGLFATGLRLVETALVPLGFFGISFYPQLSRLYTNDPVGFRRAAVRLMWAMTLAGMLVAWGMYFIAPRLLVPVLGERFAAAQTIIQVMSALALAQAVEAGLGRVLLSADRQVPRALFIAAGAVASLGLNIVLAPRYGINGAIISGVGAYLVINILSLIALERPLTLSSLIPLTAMLVLSIVLVVGVVSLLAANGFSAWIQGAVSAGVLLIAAAAGYIFRHGQTLSTRSS